ncbi:MAG: TonB-dependent receptor [Acetobacter sp.]
MYRGLFGLTISRILEADMLHNKTRLPPIWTRRFSGAGISRIPLYGFALIVLVPFHGAEAASRRGLHAGDKAKPAKHATPASQSAAARTAAKSRKTAITARDAEQLTVHASIPLSRRQVLARQDDPIAVTTVTAKDLQANQITNLLQATKLLPSVSMQITNPRNVAINVRGLGNFSSTAQDGLENGTTVYIDGVYQTRPGAVIGDISDLSEIEVLKGPQATRGGVDNDGGVININTLAPSFTRQYSITGDYGSYNTANVRLRATGAVGHSDKVAYSLSGFSINHDGYMKNVVTNRDYHDYHDLGVKGQILAKPTDALTIRLIADYSDLRESCCVSVLTNTLTHYANGAPVSGTFAERSAAAGGNPVPAHQIRDMLVSGPATGSQGVRQQTFGVSLDTTYQLPSSWTLENIAAWHTWFWYPKNGFSGGLGTIPGLKTMSAGNNQVYEQHATEELKISSPTNRPLQFSAGIFYMYEEVPDYIRNALTYQGAQYYLYGTPYAHNVYYDSLSGGTLLAHDNVITNDVAGYARLKYRITPKLSLEGGVRVSYVNKSGGYSSQIVASNALGETLAKSILGAPTSYSASYSQVQPSGSLSLVYRPVETTLLYATYSRGVRDGGINIANLNTSQGMKTTVKPELNDMFEFGVKNAFFNKRLLVNTAAFWNNVHNYITSGGYYLSTTNSVISYLINAPHVVSRGFEVDARGVILPGLEGRVSASYTDAFYANFANSTQPAESANVKSVYSLTGNQIPLNSKWNLTAGLDYTVPVRRLTRNSGDFWSRILFYVGADYSYRSRFYSDPTESIYTLVKPYGVLNGHIGIRPESGKWDLSFWGHNMLDKRYYVGITPSATGEVFYGQLADPAMFGGEFTYKL